VRRVLAVAAAIVAVGVLLVLTGVGSFARSELRRAARARHAARGETELRLVNPAGAALALFRAGATLDDAAPLALPAGEAWLPEGRYFVEATLAGERLLFPVTLDGSGEGPDDSGAWTVTVRRPPAESPPLPHERGPGFVFVPGGFFLMGDRQNPGQPHPVWVPSFHVAAFEVTNGEFRRFLADPGGYEDRSCWTEAGWRWKTSGLSQPTARLVPTDPRYPRFGRDGLPVMLVTWHEANAYCRWLTRRLGGGRWLFRLPTEAEWEKAARGPDAFDYGLTMELSEPQSPLYNWRKNPGAEVTLVGPGEGPYRPNRYGVLHASGNAREWTQSVFRRYSAESPYRDDDRNADDAEGLRVTRGGSWYSASAVRLRLAYREEFQPELSSDDLGFRIVAVLGAGQGDAGDSGPGPRLE
jgi:formylglycine-generating enzyme required for sulfatase activity